MPTKDDPIRYFQYMDRQFRLMGLNPNGYSLKNWNSWKTQMERAYFKEKLEYKNSMLG